MRGAVAVTRGRALLDEIAPLRESSHVDSRGYRLEYGVLLVDLVSGRCSSLADGGDVVGYVGSVESPDAVLFENHGLHVEIEPMIGEAGPGLAFDAARRLIVEGSSQPNGYTEPLLHGMRRRKKAEQVAAR